MKYISCYDKIKNRAIIKNALENLENGLIKTEVCAKIIIKTVCKRNYIQLDLAETIFTFTDFT